MNKYNTKSFCLLQGNSQEMYHRVQILYEYNHVFRMLARINFKTASCFGLGSISISDQCIQINISQRL